MTQAPERMPEYVWLGTYMDGFAIDGPDEKIEDLAKPGAVYRRADLSPRWRPIADYVEGNKKWCKFISRNLNGEWFVVGQVWKATHFMQLTPPEE